jgi:hypothetical protein
MARTRKPAAPKTLHADVAAMTTVAATPTPPHPPAETTDAAGAVAAAVAASVDPIQPPLVDDGANDALGRREPGQYFVSVKGPAKGRWRAGRLFGPEPVEIDCAELTADEMLALENDPELTCTWPKDEGPF